MQTKQIACLGLNHRTAPVELRERLSCSLGDVYSDGQSAGGPLEQITELVILSTCNRVELYASLDSRVRDPRALLTELLASANGLPVDDLEDHIYFWSGFEAMAHLCRVASGLDSLVLGEPQILGQVTDAFHDAEAFGSVGRILSSVGRILSLVFKSGIRAGKRSRTETTIGSNPASMSSIALATAREVVGPLRERRILVVGLGEMGLLTLKALRIRGVTNIGVANRTRTRADAVAEEWGYQAYSLQELPQALGEADVVITATAADRTVIDPALAGMAMSQRDHPLVIVDLAVPRDVDPNVGRLPNVHLFDADDLRGSLDEARAARQQQVPHVEQIIKEEMKSLRAELNELAIKPVIADLRHKAEAIRRRELERTLRHLDGVDPKTLEHIHHLSRSLVNKLLHEPTARLKDSPGNGMTREFVTTVRDLFGLTEDEESEP
jgi:glutamyl-tRNA reductase